MDLNKHLDMTVLVNVKVPLILLLLSSVLLPLTIPQARTQSTITSTNVQTLTSSVASTWYSTFQRTSTATQPFHFDVTPYDYNSEKNFFTLNQFMISGYRNWYCLYYDYFQLNVPKGFEMRGHYETLHQMATLDLYILNSDQLQRFNRSYCGYGNWTADMHLSAPSADFDWIAPQSGNYALLFLTTLWYNGPISFTVNGYITTVQSSIVTYATTQTYMSMVSQIVMSTLPAASLSSTSYYPLMLIALIIVGCIIITVLLTKRRRSSP